MRLHLDRRASPVSPLLVVTDDAGILRALYFDGGEGRMRRLLQLHYGDATLQEGRTPTSIGQALDAYFAGDIDALDGLEVRTGGTPFQQEVWKALRSIPSGTTVSYGQLAARLGRGGASRAVGAANGTNPVSIVVPCHRVVGANGTLTGYGGGLAKKEWLLAHEARHSPVLSVT